MPFGSFYYITVLVRTSSTMLKRNVNSRHSCYFPDLKENAFSISACLIFMADFFFISLGGSLLLRILIMTGCLIL